MSCPVYVNSISFSVGEMHSLSWNLKTESCCSPLKTGSPKPELILLTQDAETCRFMLGDSASVLS